MSNSFATPWTVALQASLSITNFQSLLKLMSIKLVMPSNHLILCCLLLLLPSIFPSIRFDSNDIWPNSLFLAGTCTHCPQNAFCVNATHCTCNHGYSSESKEKYFSYRFETCEGKGVIFFSLLFFVCFLPVLGLNCNRQNFLVAECKLLVPWPGVKPRPPALGAQSLSHWTTREPQG